MRQLASADLRSSDSETVPGPNSGNQVEVLGALLAQGADVGCINNNGATALFIAAENGHAEAVRVLGLHGACPSALDQHGATPAYIAARNARDAVLCVLAELGADLQRGEQQEGLTPLHIATIKLNVSAVRTLIDLGVAPAARTDSASLCNIIGSSAEGGHTALDVATAHAQWAAGRPAAGGDTASAIARLLKLADSRALVAAMQRLAWRRVCQQRPFGEPHGKKCFARAWQEAPAAHPVWCFALCSKPCSHVRGICSERRAGRASSQA